MFPPSATDKPDAWKFMAFWTIPALVRHKTASGLDSGGYAGKEAPRSHSMADSRARQSPICRQRILSASADSGYAIYKGFGCVIENCVQPGVAIRHRSRFCRPCALNLGKVNQR